MEAFLACESSRPNHDPIIPSQLSGIVRVKHTPIFILVLCTIFPLLLTAQHTPESVLSVVATDGVEHAVDGAFMITTRAMLADVVPVQEASHGMLPLDGAPAGRERKSGFLGILYSSLLPGMGELYAERFDRGRYPLIADGVLWLALAGVNVAGAWVQDDARTFAVQAAGVDTRRKDEQFFVDIGNYASLADYNAAKRIERAVDRLYPEDPAAGYGWEWRTSTDRTTYRDQRIRADELFNASGFVVLGLIANRIWSAVQAALSVKSYNALLDGSAQLPMLRTQLMSVNGKTDGMRFVFTTVF